MAATLHAELDAAGSTVILVAVGDSTDVNQMAQALKHVTPGFKRSEPPGALLMELSWAGITQLAHTFDGIAEHGFWVPGPRLRAWIAAEFEARVSESRLAPMTWTGTDGRTPRPYQLDAARMIDAAGKFLLFDEPGTGKSASTILGLSRRLLRGIDVFPAVIIAPSWDVIDNWTREIALWMPAWRVIEWKGADRARHLRFRDAYDVFVTTYATARRDARDVRGPLVKLNAATVVVDELHWTKSADAQQTQAVERIARHATSFVGLTGTPITRDTGDIFPALKSMDPAAWPAKERFVKRYCTTGDGDYDNPVEGLDRLYEGEFRACLLGSYRRVAKADVLDQLPKKIYSVRHVDLLVNTHPHGDHVGGAAPITIGAGSNGYSITIGGTVSGEHGVGVEKLNSMCVQFSPAEREQFFAVKRAFDPAGLLNPGKVIPSLQRCAEYGKMHVHRGMLPFPNLPRY